MSHELQMSEDFSEAWCSCGEWSDRDIESEDDARMLWEAHVQDAEAEENP